MTTTDALTRWQAVVDALKERIARADAALPGPWAEGTRESTCIATDNGHGYPVLRKTNQGSMPCDSDWAFIAASRTEHPAAHKALLEIAELHAPDTGRGDAQCGECVPWETGEGWPCPTFVVVERAAGLEQ